MSRAEPNKKISVMIGGFQKTATTSLFRTLSSHAGLYGHGQREFLFLFRDVEWNAGWPAATQTYFPDLRDDDDRLVLAKHVLFCLSRASIERLHAHNPSAKVILALRDPVDRAYSAYWQNRRDGRERARTFAEAIDREFERPNEHLAVAYLQAGQYVDHVETIERLFGMDHLRLISSKRVKSSFGDVVSETLAWLGLEPAGDAVDLRVVNQAAAPRSQFLPRMLDKISYNDGLKNALKRIIPAGKLHKIKERLIRLNEKPVIYEPIDSAMRARLDEYFAPYNARLLSRYGVMP